MKSILLFIAVLCALTLSNSLTPTAVRATSMAKKDRAVIKFSQPLVLMGATLQGEYLFVHDDAAMARGEACTFVYKGNVEIPNKLVVSFHCTPAVRDKVARFTVRSVQVSPGLSEIREFQFGGMTEAHLVPVPVN